MARYLVSEMMPSTGFEHTVIIPLGVVSRNWSWPYWQYGIANTDGIIPYSA